jgi:MYXO-CTERM domain-containing protein
MLQLTRTSFVCLGLLAGAASTAAAESRFAETIVHDSTTTTSIELSPNTVLCSSADYGSLHLKVLIPKLASLTLLDHQNFGAGAPCVAAGQCKPGNMPSDIIDPANPSENVTMHVKAVRLDETDVAAQTCTTYLVERVNVTIRGFEFKHERSVELGSRAFSDCAPGAPIDGPADDPGSVDEKPEAGGCNTRSGGASSLLGLLLALVAVRRRKTA